MLLAVDFTRCALKAVGNGCDTAVLVQCILEFPSACGITTGTPVRVRLILAKNHNLQVGQCSPPCEH